MTYDSLAERLRRYGQEHVLRWWNGLQPEQQEPLARQIDAIDFDLLNRCREVSPTADEDSPAHKARRATPPAQLIRAPVTAADRAEWDRAKSAGGDLLRSGRVGAILVAGGQGTRLDFPHPKGMFPIGPVSGKSLFQLLAEQLLARSRQAGVSIPYGVMTSDATHEETIAFFESHGHFGLNPADVHFFQQGTLPAVAADTGRLLLAEKHAISTSPDGHGGLLAALSTSGLLNELRARGVEYFYYHQVDNPLAAVCDPAFLGFHLLKDAEVSTKVVAKQSPDEKMGVVVDVDGQPQIIEYSDLPADVAQKRKEPGRVAQTNKEPGGAPPAPAPPPRLLRR